MPENLTTACSSFVVADTILLQCLLSATVRWPESAGVPAIREMGAVRPTRAQSAHSCAASGAVLES